MLPRHFIPSSRHHGSSPRAHLFIHVVQGSNITTRLSPRPEILSAPRRSSADHRSVTESTNRPMSGASSSEPSGMSVRWQMPESTGSPRRAPSALPDRRLNARATSVGGPDGYRRGTSSSWARRLPASPVRRTEGVAISFQADHPRVSSSSRRRSPSCEIHVFPYFPIAAPARGVRRKPASCSKGSPSR